MDRSHASIGFAGFYEGREFGMICPCLSLTNPKVFSTHTDLLVFAHGLVFAGFSVIRRHVLSLWCGGQKNTLRLLWTSLPELLRPHPQAGSRSVVWGHAHLSRFRGAPCGLPALRVSKARALGICSRQPVLYQAFCLLRWATVSLCHNQRYRRGA